MTEEKLRALDRFEESSIFSEREKLALRLAEKLAAAPAEVDDELFAQLRRHFDFKQLEELTSAIAWENYLARHNRVFAIESDGFLEGAYCPMPVRRH